MRVPGFSRRTAPRRRRTSMQLGSKCRGLSLALFAQSLRRFSCFYMASGAGLSVGIGSVHIVREHVVALAVEYVNSVKPKFSTCTIHSEPRIQEHLHEPKRRPNRKTVQVEHVALKVFEKPPLLFLDESSSNSRRCRHHGLKI